MTQTPAAKLRTEIAKAASSPWMRVGPLAAIIPLIDAWVVDTERRLGMLAAAQLRQHFGVERHPAQLQGLAAMGDDAATVLEAYAGKAPARHACGSTDPAHDCCGYEPDGPDSVRLTTASGTLDIPLTPDGHLDYLRVMSEGLK